MDRLNDLFGSEFSRSKVGGRGCAPPIGRYEPISSSAIQLP